MGVEQQQRLTVRGDGTGVDDLAASLSSTTLRRFCEAMRREYMCLGFALPKGCVGD